MQLFEFTMPRVDQCDAGAGSNAMYAFQQISAALDIAIIEMTKQPDALRTQRGRPRSIRL